MSNNYLKNLLDKSIQAQRIVEPRLKSRFEASNGTYRDAGFEDTVEKGATTIQKGNRVVENGLEGEFKGVPETIQTIKSEDNSIVHSLGNQTKFLKTTENHFLSLEYKGNEDLKNRIEPKLSNSMVDEKGLVDIPINNSTNTIGGKTYGQLNKPVKSITENEKSLKENYKAIVDENKLTTPVQHFIKISIGKIEVKVVKAPQKMPAKPKTKPDLKMSLKDYIDNRK